MPKPELGTKRTCLTCGARFYDFGKTVDIACPACGAAFDLEQVARVRRPRSAPRAAVATEEEVDETEAEEVDETEEEEADEVDEVEDVDEEEAEEPDAEEAETPAGDDEEEDDALIEDADELGDDDDALGEVIDPAVGEDDDQR